MSKRMKGALFVFIVALAVLFPNISSAKEGRSGTFKFDALGLSWKKKSGSHFIVHYTGKERFAKDVVDEAEVYYKHIASGIGYSRYSEFWTWDNRVNIYIYPDHVSYLKATKAPQWTHGMADYDGKFIVSYEWGEGFMNSLLPHEMAHLIFRDFVGFKGEVPLWLNEGVAQWAEEEKRSDFRIAMGVLRENDQILAIEKMMVLDIRALAKPDRIYPLTSIKKSGEYDTIFLSSEHLVSTFYLQSMSLVDFLIERYGSKRFAEFCRQLRDGKSLEVALRYSYPSHIRSLKEFEGNWMEYLGKN